MKISVLLLVLFITVTGSAQQALPKIASGSATIGAFIPAGYDTLMMAAGDLNKDSLADIVLALKSSREDNFDPVKDDMDSIPARLLIILLNNGKGYTLSALSSGAIMCKECGGVFGDPFAGITITKAVLVIDHYGGSNWRWEYTHRFRYQQNDFYLIGKTSNSYWNIAMCDKLNEFAGTDYKDENLITGAFVQKKISQEGCKWLVNKKGKQKVEPLIKLKDFIIEN